MTPLVLWMAAFPSDWEEMDGIIKSPDVYILTIFIFYIISVHIEVMLGAYIKINNYYVLLNNKPFVIMK